MATPTLLYANRLCEVADAFFEQTGINGNSDVYRSYRDKVATFAEAVAEENSLDDPSDIDKLSARTTVLGKKSLDLLEDLEANLCCRAQAARESAVRLVAMIRLHNPQEKKD